MGNLQFVIYEILVFGQILRFIDIHIGGRALFLFFIAIPVSVLRLIH